MTAPRPRAVLAVLTVLAALASALVSGCSSLSGVAPTLPSVSPGHSQLYVSIGDSYAAGYQPSDQGGSTTRNGFAYQVAAEAEPDGLPLVLANFGCSGLTSTQIVEQRGCASGALGPDGISEPDAPQGAAALALITSHAAEIGLVTVIMGGNDLQPCLTDADPQGCVEQRLPAVRRNVTGLVQRIRQVVGSSVPIVGLTYPDVYLGAYLRGAPGATQLAQRSRELFQTYLNPTLAEAYRAEGAVFVDITALTGAYGSMDAMTEVPPYGRLPVPVAKVCRLTFYCSAGDVHPTNAGYTLIARAVIKAAAR